MIPIVVNAQRTVPKGLRKKNGGTGNQTKNRNPQNHSIVKIGENTEKSPGGSEEIY